MTILQIAAVVGSIVLLLGSAVVAAAGIIDTAIRNLAATIQREHEANRRQLGELARSGERQTMLPPPPKREATSLMTPDEIMAVRR